MYNNTHYQKSGPIARRSIIKTILNHDINKEIHLLHQTDIIKLCELIPTTLTKEDDNIRQQNAVIYQSRQEQFEAKFKFTKRLETNPDCKIIHQLGKCTPENVLTQTATYGARMNANWKNILNTTAASQLKKRIL